jgi:hypothetical protein
MLSLPARKISPRVTDILAPVKETVPRSGDRTPFYPYERKELKRASKRRNNFISMEAPFRFFQFGISHP